MKKIAITGTKGKTTVSSILSDVLRAVEPKVLHVDTNGAYLNGEMKISKLQSQTTWDVVPTVAPGRFLYLLHDPNTPPEQEENHTTVAGAAVLEASLGCGTVSGLGYYGHDVGVFTNVFEDHIGSRPDLKTRADIGKSKSFIFSRINRDGYAVFNADDDIVVECLSSCKEGVTFIPFGLDFNHFDIKKHLISGGQALSIRNNMVVLLSAEEEKELIAMADVAWTFEGNFTPSVYNLLAVLGALIGYENGNIRPKLISAVRNSRLDPLSGRLTLFRNDNNVKILADYAHEKQSLKSISELAARLKSDSSNKVIGVLRLAWDRTPELIGDTAHYISDSYDTFVIYDKIDGFWRKPSVRFRTHQRQFTQESGKISSLFTNALLQDRKDSDVQRVVREDEAIEYAAKIAKPGDVVVFIVNDDIRRSIEFVKKSFEAELA